MGLHKSVANRLHTLARRVGVEKEIVVTGGVAKNNGGTGLGLSVCAAIVKEHKGDLAFDSTAGKGTTVTLCLPACQ